MAEKQLLVGYAKEKLNPPMGMKIPGHGFMPRPSEGIQDDVHVYALAFSDGENQAVLFNVDALGGNALTDHVFLSQFLNSSGTFAVATQGADAFSGATGTVESLSPVEVCKGIFSITLMAFIAAGIPVRQKRSRKFMVDILAELHYTEYPFTAVEQYVESLCVSCSKVYHRTCENGREKAEFPRKKLCNLTA